MSLILNIETSTDICSVCISDKDKVLAYREIQDEKSHASKLGIFIDELFKELNIDAKDLEAIAVSQGPGSYTGLRIGVSTAKGIAYAADKPLIALDSYKAMAQKVLDNLKNQETNINNILLCPMIDARRMEVYTAIYDENLSEIEKINAKVIDENSFGEYLKTKTIYFFGNGSEKCKNVINLDKSIFLENINPSSKNLIYDSMDKFQRNDFVDVAYFEPFYLKDFIATQPKKNLLT